MLDSLIKIIWFDIALRDVGMLPYIDVVFLD